MAAIKQNSTNQENKQAILNFCPVTVTLGKIGGRWKPLIIYNLQQGMLRYAQLKKAIPGITEKMLIQHLRELEADDLVKRDVKPVVPPHVEYSLTQRGKSLNSLLNEMAEWGRVQGINMPA
ncbi:MAG: winged helix-turn-helix transcriptional regulator [Sphingobacteriales bacterium]